MTREVTVGVGAAVGHLGVDEVIDLGPLHPSAHGAYRLRLRVTGPAGDPVVAAADPMVGLLHRGAEKLFEVRDYRQVLALANRHDWLAACCNEVAVALAVERMMGIDLPARAVRLRTALCELTRAMAHLAFLTPLTHAPPTPAPPTAAGAGTRAAVGAREAVQDLLEEAAGGRIHFMVNRIGGLRADVPAGWPQRAAAVAERLHHAADEIQACTVDDPDFAARHRGIGVLAADHALALGITGHLARASGVDADLRRDDPVLAYGELDVTPVLGSGGDALSRVRCQLGEVRLAARLVTECLAGLPGGPVGVRLPTSVIAPEGTVYQALEAPLGTCGVLLTSRGERVPWRLKLRTPSFNNIQALSALLPGTRVADLPAVLGSFSVVVGDIDK